MSCSISRMVRPPSRKAQHQATNVLGLIVIHSCHRLIEQQQPGVGRERARHFDLALRAIGQRARALVADVLETEKFEDLFGACDGHAIGPARRQRPAPQRALTGLGDQQMFPDGHAGKQPDVLECAHGAGPRDPVRTPMGDRPCRSKWTSPLLARVGAGDDVEERGLAGAVGSDHATICPWRTSQDNPESALIPPKDLVTSLNCRRGALMPAACGR